VAKKPRYTWDPESGRYRDTRTGRFVPETQIRTAIDRAIIKANGEVASLARQLRKGDITLEEWSEAMRTEIKAQQLAAAMVARGGVEQMTQDDYGRVGGQIANQYRYLNNFQSEIAGGLPLDGRFINRVQLYSEAARTTFEQTKRDVEEETGSVEESNVLGAADHCSECIGLTLDGWVPIGTMPPPGRRICGNKCKCRLKYR
jgi:hypothetical protein